jgi:hypothetical protein
MMKHNSGVIQNSVTILLNKQNSKQNFDSNVEIYVYAISQFCYEIRILVEF